jgi:hypothetical protein
MNAGRESRPVRVPGANDDAGVRLVGTVKAAKVTPVERQDSAPLSDGERQHRVVRDSLIRLPCFTHREHVMTETAQLHDDGVIEIFIGVESRHWYQASPFSQIACSISSWCSP